MRRTRRYRRSEWSFLGFVATFFYPYEKRSREEYRGVCTGGDADKQCERKHFCRHGADDVEHEQSEKHGERRVDGTNKRLIERVASGLRKTLLAVLFVIDAQVLTRPVEDDDGVVNREAEHGEHSRYKERVHLRAG